MTQKNKKTNNALSKGRMIDNTLENIKEAEISMEFALPQERENLEEKNSRRRQAVSQLKEQLKEEEAFNSRKDNFK